MEKWECYYKKNEKDDVNGDINFCVLQDDNVGTSQEKSMHYNSFFWDWVYHMLHDSVEWRKELKKCIENPEKKCKNGCNRDCKCYESWVKGKKEEFNKIKDHFRKQKDMLENKLNKAHPDITLNFTLNTNFLNDIKDAYLYKQQLEKIRKLLGDKIGEKFDPYRPQTSIDDVLQEEERFAKECQQKQNQCEEQERGVARSNTSPSSPPAVPVESASDDEDEDEEEEEEEGDLGDKGDGAEETAKKEEKKDACAIVEGILKGDRGDGKVGECKKKDFGGNSYPDWQCDEHSNLVTGNGECMPPRRQKLCLHYLAHERQTENIITDDDLREAFIKTAAAETFLAWQYYKSKHGNGANELIQNLKKGQIPPEFLRSMFYTFGDYRDICLDTDISVKQGDVSNAKNKIDKIFLKKDDQTPDEQRKAFWEKYGKDIWKGMLCALSYDTSQNNVNQETRKKLTEGNNNFEKVIFGSDSSTTLSKFSERPQFLRWLTEWGEEFCRTRGVKIKELVQGCEKCTLGTDGTCGKECDECKKQCDLYREFIKKWKGYYTSQSKKYSADKDNDPYKSIGEVQNSTHAYEYLYKQLKHFTCENGDCKCMQEKSNKPSTDGNTDSMPASLDYPPEGYTNKCDCKDEKELKPEAAPSVPQVNVCETVANILTGEGNLDAACKQKYSEPNRYWGWKCVPSGDSTATSGGGKSGDTDTTGSEPKGQRRDAAGAHGKSDNTGSVCVPPRRRKLYIHDLQSLSGEDGKTQSHKQLLEWFVKSAAVETFFLWDRYKKEWKAQHGAGPLGGVGVPGGAAQALSSVPGSDSVEQNPEQELKSGEIPTDFLRQMFYTLGDYRDICVGVEDDVADALEKSVDNNRSGEKSNNITMKQISGKIDEILKNGDKNPKHWWNENAKDIWKGMVCALTYKDNSETEEKKNDDTNKPILDDTVKKAFFGTQNGNPRLQPGNKNGTYKETYDYSKVELKEENSATEGPKPTYNSPASGAKTPSPSGEKITLLTDFISRPTYFRYLEEWGQNFCKERKKRLEEVRKACRENSSHNDTFCSGDGHDCTDNDRKYNNMFADLDCRPCYKQCRKYRKWIDIKFEEYEKQKCKYQGEHDKLKANSNDGDNKEFCQQIEKKNTAAEFLKELKHCKNNQNSENKGNQEEEKNNKINFEEPLETFSRSTYCKTCPYNIVKCNGRRGKDPCTEVNGNGKTWQSVFNSINGNNEKITANITVEMIDRRGPYMKEYMKEKSQKSKDSNDLFNASRLFKSVRKQQWTCKVIDDKMDICKLTNFNNEIDLNEYTTFKVFLEYWLEDFLYGYYLLKKRKIIDKCTENGGETCNGQPKNGCACVKEWVEQKQSEWKKINDHYNKKEYGNGHDMAYKVTSYFEKYANDVNKSIDNFEGLKQIYEYEDCNGDKNCNFEGKKRKKDMVTLLLYRLQNEINKCPSSTSGSEQCTTPPSNLDDDDTPDEPLDDYYIQQPKICPPPMTCVERAAKQLREEAEGKVNNELKGTGLVLNGKCNKVQKNDAANVKDACDFEKTYKNSVQKITKICERIGMNRLMIGQKWNSKYISKIGNVLYIPPRREYMCLDALNTLGRLTINDSNDLLKKVQEAAEHEGNDIIRTLLPINVCNENVICDAMKYSFADLGDIIRGRDLLNENRKAKGLQTRLGNAFENIYKNVHKKKEEYGKEIPHYYKLRSDWWDANRKEVWKAMTCNAPDAAKFLKKDKNFSSGKFPFYSNGVMSNDPNCGHKSEPPDYDYIPQPFRWMQEWSEYYCKARINEIEKLQTECNECKTNASSCQEGDGKKCEKCKTKCKSFNDFVQQWQRQFNIQSQTYKELYDKAMKNNSDGTATPSNDKSVEGRRSQKDRGKPRAPQEDDSISIEFLKQVKVKCEDPNISEKYLDKANNCIQYTFAISSGGSGDNNYAFENPPKDFEQACKCEVPDPLNDCPKDSATYEKACNTLLPTRSCESKTFNNDDDSWDSSFVQKSPGENTGVLVPPRRRELCIKNITIKLRSITNKDGFKTELMNSAYNEGKLLGEKYDKDKEKAFQAMKYSFADYGDIIKGTDMMENLKILNKKLDELFKTNDGNERSQNRGKWWANNKNRVWHAMLCGYKFAGGNLEDADCSLPDDSTHQFLRWFREWSEHFCDRRKKLYDDVQKECESSKCNRDDGMISLPECENACLQYKNYIIRKREEYRLLIHQYNVNYKEQKAHHKNAPEYFNAKCNSKCACLSKYIDKEQEWKNIYDSLNDNNLKNICDCIKIKPTYFPKNNKPKDETAPDEPKHKEDKIEPPEPPLPPADQPFDPTILQTTIPFGVALALGSIAFLFLKVIYIVVYICIYIYMCFLYMYVWVCLDLYMDLHVCVLYIFYIYVFILIKKKMKKKKKRKKRKILKIIKIIIKI